MIFLCYRQLSGKKPRGNKAEDNRDSIEKTMGSGNIHGIQEGNGQNQTFDGLTNEGWGLLKDSPPQWALNEERHEQ